ncbi:MAG: CRTAC1 family protein, partial [Gemmatimonadetes bacterium]
FSFEFSLAVPDPAAVLAALRFADGTRLAGLAGLGAGPSDAPLAPALAPGDWDGDGDEDLFVTGDRPTLLRDDLGLMEDVTEAAGLPRSPLGPARFADLDNDGHLDIVAVSPAGLRIFQATGEETFTDGSPAPEPAGTRRARALHDVLAADLDHDGDLDLFAVGDGGYLLLRNGGEAGWADLTEPWGLAGGADAAGREAAFADLDDDGDLDLIVADEARGTRVFSNERGGRFKERAGAVPAGPAWSVAVADYDNDGAFDLALAASGRVVVLRNRGDGTFVRDDAAARPLARAAGVRAVRFVDVDNDGRQDLVTAGAGGVRIHHNDGGRFTGLSGRLPDGLGEVRRIAVADYNQDGDLDLFALTPDGVRLLRNDGGNVNHYLDLRLTGLATGSGKNNRFGIGSRIEVRAGDLYQVLIADDPTVHVGLGANRKADVVRIEWPNGVGQDIYFPGTDQDLEDQILKGSCPFLYTWTGERFEFQKDIMWKSALGMPTGIQGNQGRRAYAPAAASVEYVRIPGDALAERDGRYTLQVTEELWETIYFDEVDLVAVDHPDDVDVYVNERFVPPGPPVSLDLRYVRDRRPARAYTGRGRDVTEELARRDFRFVGDFDLGPVQGLAEWHDLVLDPGAVPEDATLRLYLSGWVFPADASLNVQLAQSGAEGLRAPELQVIGPDGAWT